MWHISIILMWINVYVTNNGKVKYCYVLSCPVHIPPLNLCAFVLSLDYFWPFFLNVREHVSVGWRDHSRWVGGCHLRQLIRHGSPLIRPSLSLHETSLSAHLFLQLLQTLFHTRRHLQTVRQRTPQVKQTSPVQEWQQDMINETPGN